MKINIAECKAAGLDPAKVTDLARLASRAGVLAESMGLTIFGSGEGRIQQRKADRPLVLAYLDGNFDGGAGDARDAEDGLLRGE